MTRHAHRLAFLLAATLSVPALAAPHHHGHAHDTAKPADAQAAPAVPTPAVPLPAGGKPAAGRTAVAAGRYVSFPSFLMKDEVICLDELDFNAYAGSRKFNTRGSVETCQRVDRLTRVAVLAQSGTKSQIRVMGGPLDANVGWTNARLPIAGAKP